MPGLCAWAIGITTITGLFADTASAQYYCDSRYEACPAYRQPPPQPQPIFPFGLFQPRQAAPPPEPAPYAPPPQAAPTAPARPGYAAQPIDPTLGRQYASLYAPVSGEPFPIPGVRLSDIDPEYLRKAVPFPTNEPPGTIIVDAQNRFLYFVQGGGRAIRYGVGVGRQGFGWSGVATIHDKQAWPDWYPPKEMVARQPELRRQLSELQSGLGVAGGPRNPLGARAMYLWQGNKDTLFRIHGTFEPWTIGKNVSSGCIRMINQDVIDLYERAPVGAKVVVMQARS
jgi:lipoprotein-anchoring transpeptidase ErfK/SrfK